MMLDDCGVVKLSQLRVGERLNEERRGREVRGCAGYAGRWKEIKGERRMTETRRDMWSADLLSGLRQEAPVCRMMAPQHDS